MTSDLLLRRKWTLRAQGDEVFFVLAKWDTPVDPFIDIVRDALSDFARYVSFDLLCFPADSAERFIGDQGEINVSHADLDWVRLG
jgi:hypothetical protein